MRARHVFLALLILLGGLGINAYQRGSFAAVERNLRQNWLSFMPAARLMQSSEYSGGLQLAGSEASAGDWREVKRSEQTLAAKGANRVVISNPFGHIFVTGKGQKIIGLETVKWGRATTFEARLRNSDLARLQISRAGRDLKLTVTGPPDYSSKAQIDLYLTLPQEFSLRGESIIGNFHIENLQGDIKVDTINSKIEIIGGKKITAGSVNGEIAVNDATGPVLLENKNGGITLDGVTGKIEASSVSGGISTYYTGGSMAFSTISGEIAAGVAGHYAGKLTAKSVTGPIRLILPSDINCRVKADTISGDIYNSLPLKDQVAKPHHFEGLAGDGRGEIEASTVSGDISPENDANYPIPWAP